MTNVALRDAKDRGDREGMLLHLAHLLSQAAYEAGQAAIAGDDEVCADHLNEVAANLVASRALLLTAGWRPPGFPIPPEALQA